jgi:hypothetical protein
MTTKITEQNISELANTGVNWQSVFTGDGSTGLTAVAGRGYFIDTTSGTVTVTLPASPSAGDVVVLKDYARTWGTNNITIASNTFDGTSKSTTFSTTGQTVTLVYMDGTKGWSIINEDTTTDLSTQFIAATGGTITTSGDFKIHTFTGDGCFVVSQAGSGAGPSVVDYLVVAGGGGGGRHQAGGAGAGGFRESSGNAGCYTASPLATPTGITLTATTYPITVGAGGAAGVLTNAGGGTNGSNSVFSTITSAGGGHGGGYTNTPTGDPGEPGGSGGGGSSSSSTSGLMCNQGTGNTPPVSPSQGNPGGKGYGVSPHGAGGGGGATQAGNPGPPNGSPICGPAGPGGDGATTSISGSPTTYAGGGGGAHSIGIQGSGGSGGGGEGGTCGSPNAGGQAGTANTGGGGGGGSQSSDPGTGTGGKGIVIIRYKYQ